MLINIIIIKLIINLLS